jgi:carboxyl-terminal processing protease
MTFMRTSRVPAAAIVAALSVAAGIGLGSVTVETQDRATVRRQIYAEALAVVENEYVEPLDAHCTNAAPCGTEAAVYDSIDGMLRTLDPHSSFFTPRDFRALRERQEGRYFGIGIQIGKIGPDVVVSSVFEGSPSHRAGIRRGDVIARVGTEDANNWTTQDVVDRVKGPKGTSVEVGIRRSNVDGLITLTVPRDEIRIPSVRTSFMVDGVTGYVRLQDFSETTTTELRSALAELKRAGMQQLLLDLRDNPGGPLDQAISVASQFLRKGEKIVYTRGRIARADDDFNVEAPGGYDDLPLIVLVDRQSASASEIVSGAIQDHDRGLVVGETTFGKALVQTVFPISGGAGLALTTGRYYTPSDRLIQRPWDGSFDDYLTYFYRDQNPTPKHDESKARETDAKRKVYEGGGIEPDHFVVGPIEGFNPTRFSRLLMNRTDLGFVDFAERFSRVGDDRPGARSSPQSHKVDVGWKVTDALVDEFRAYLTERRIKIDEAAFATDLPFIKAMIHFEVDVDLWGIEEARKNLAVVDPQLRAGLGYFDETKQLLATRKRT